MAKILPPLVVAIILGYWIFCAWQNFPVLINEKRYLIESPNASNIGVPPFNLEKNGQLSDSYGAFSALLSGITIIGLFLSICYQAIQLSTQRQEFELQRKGMIYARQEFLANRATSVIYSQLDRFSDAIKEFSIKMEDKTLTGREAFSQLSSLYNEEIKSLLLKKRPKKPGNKTKSLSKLGTMMELEKENYNSVLSIVRIISQNIESFNEFLSKTHNIISVVVDILLNAELDEQEIILLYSVFVRNIGKGHTDILDFIIKERGPFFIRRSLEDLYNDLYEGINKTELDSLVPKAQSIHDFFTSKLTKENLEQVKQDWKINFI
ncbi:hypothetical protein P1X15_07090 [Runella sp. MFBS21]|uniref:hypothetical protein n=1 Tax=Runella sp. MFBS21 TaxID=3034018 RepID=UPI0023F83888|nr:hypothetical protein [Runella sp. MFBS21]MDF7817351.1 hypothetical protein [Runella sp. MFBS21]